MCVCVCVTAAHGRVWSRESSPRRPTESVPRCRLLLGDAMPLQPHPTPRCSSRLSTTGRDVPCVHVSNGRNQIVLKPKVKGRWPSGRSDPSQRGGWAGTLGGAVQPIWRVNAWEKRRHPWSHLCGCTHGFLPHPPPSSSWWPSPGRHPHARTCSRGALAAPSASRQRSLTSSKIASPSY